LSDRCQNCNGAIAAILLRLGSLFCHDCRKPGSIRHGGFSG